MKLAGHNTSDWELQRWALARVAQLDAAVARKIVESNAAHIAKGFRNWRASIRRNCLVFSLWFRSSIAQP